jgi:hypothetical protein
MMNIVKDAMEFTKAYNRRKFNQIEADLCVVYSLVAASINKDRDEIQLEHATDGKRKRSLSEEMNKLWP